MNRNNTELTTCLIAMPGEKDLVERLQTVKNTADEIIVADLGADPNDIASAELNGATVLQIPWENSFSQVKNHCMEHASGRWILFLHQNEFFDPESWSGLRRLLANPNADAYLVFAPYRKDGVSSPVQSLRLLRNRKEYRFEYRSFEKIADDVFINIVDSHLSLLNTEPSGETRERRTRSQLLQTESAENPNDGYLSYMEALEEINSGELEKSIPYFRKAIETLRSEPLYAPHLYKCFAWALLCLGRHSESAELLDRAIKEYPLYTDLYVMRAEIYRQSGDYPESVRCLESCLSILQQPSLFVPGSEIAASDVWVSLADLYSETGNESRALLCRQQAYEISPENSEYLEQMIHSPDRVTASETLEFLLKAALDANRPEQASTLIDFLLRQREFTRVLKDTEEFRSVLNDENAMKNINLSCRMMLENLPDNCFEVSQDSPLFTDFLLKHIRNCWYHRKNIKSTNLLKTMEQNQEIDESIKASYQCVQDLLDGKSDFSNESVDYETIAAIHKDFLSFGQKHNARILLPLLLNLANDDQLIRLADDWARQNHFPEIQIIFAAVKNDEKKDEFLRHISQLLILENHTQTARKVLSLGNCYPGPELDSILWTEDFLRSARKKTLKLKDTSNHNAVQSASGKVKPELLQFCQYLSSSTNADNYERKSNAQIHQEIGDLYSKQNKWSEALTAYLRALSYDPINLSYQGKVLELVRNSHTQLRKVRKFYQTEKESFFANREDFFLFVYGMVLFRKHKYSSAFHLFRNQTNSEACRCLFTAYRTAIQWIQNENARAKSEESTPYSAEMLWAVCKAATLDRLAESKNSFWYCDLLDFESEKIRNEELRS